VAENAKFSMLTQNIKWTLKGKEHAVPLKVLTLLALLA
jgi:hypothetical protein